MIKSGKQFRGVAHVHLRSVCGRGTPMDRLRSRKGSLVFRGLALAVMAMLFAASCSSDGDDVETGGRPVAASAPGSMIGAAAGYELKQAFDHGIEITSTAFSRIRRMAIDFTCTDQRNLTQKGEWEFGLNRSPQLAWTGVPDGTVTIALVMDDPDVIDADAEILNALVHWVIWNLPPDTTELAEDVATTTQVASIGPNVKQGTNDYGVVGYTGPCPSLFTTSISQSGGTYDSSAHYYTGIPVLAHAYAFKVYALDTELDLAEGATKDELLQAMDGHILAGGEVKGEYRPKALFK